MMKEVVSGVGSRSESISQRYRSGDSDPDPNHNVTDPQHWLGVLYCTCHRRTEILGIDNGSRHLFLTIEHLLTQLGVLRIRIQDPRSCAVVTTVSGVSVFRIPDLGSRSNQSQTQRFWKKFWVKKN
jgi:hypothetical protein